MFIPLGTLFLLGSLSASSALPPCVCTRNLKPVCGSDGQTYGNKCLLECAQVSNPQLFKERDGRCDGSNLGPPREVRQAPVDCICTFEYRPFCGTDGVTYPNVCSLKCAKLSSPVDIAYEGQCRNKREAENVAHLISGCSCPTHVHPVCGSDGNTYDNDCMLDCASNNKPELRLQHVGSCGDETELRFCSHEDVPVCGTDGTTYKNPCYLKYAQDGDKNLDVLHVGECDSDVQVVDFECSGCTLEVRPMCGTDGNTYRSPCMLNCAREHDENLHIDYVGPCDSRLKFVDSLACAACTRKVKAVCGDDGKTYRNPCMLNCARADDKNLHIEHVGPCDNTVKVENLLLQ